jgi:FkbM family methyltransferase
MKRTDYYLNSIAYIVNRFVLGRKHLVGTATQYRNLKIRFSTPDGGGREIYKKGYYEPDLSDYLLRHLWFEKGDIIFDVGANVGWYSVLLSSYFAREATIYAFEPDPDNYSSLLWNLEKNHCPNVVAVKKGIAEQAETRHLHKYKSSNPGRHSMLDINPGPSIAVETISFNEFIEEQQLDAGRIRFLKIDIEGYEYFAFKGGSKLLEHVPVILAEFSPGYMRKGGVDPAGLIHLLSSYGYTPFVPGYHEKKKITVEELLKREKNINLIWEKNS